MYSVSAMKYLVPWHGPPPPGQNLSMQQVETKIWRISAIIQEWWVNITRKMTLTSWWWSEWWRGSILSSWEFLSLIMSSYQEFTELTMTDSGRGFSNPAYHDNTSIQENSASSSSPSVATVQSNGKTVSRSNSIGEDPDHIEVLKMILYMKNHDLCVRCH